MAGRFPNAHGPAQQQQQQQQQPHTMPAPQAPPPLTAPIMRDGPTPFAPVHRHHPPPGLGPPPPVTAAPLLPPPPPTPPQQQPPQSSAPSPPGHAHPPPPMRAQQPMKQAAAASVQQQQRLQQQQPGIRQAVPPTAVAVPPPPPLQQQQQQQHPWPPPALSAPAAAAGATRTTAAAAAATSVGAAGQTAYANGTRYHGGPLAGTPPVTAQRQIPARPLPPDARGVAAITAGVAATTLMQSTVRPQPLLLPQQPPAQHYLQQHQQQPATFQQQQAYPPPPMSHHAQMAPSHPQNATGHHHHQGLHPAAISDPRLLPRPDLSPQAVALRIAQGDPPPPAPPAPAFGDPSAFSQQAAAAANAEPAACHPHDFIPASPRAVRLCAGAFPSTATLAKRYALPLGGIIQPLVQPGIGESPTPIVNFGSSGIVRCRRCRSYISAWCRFQDGGRRWVCCMCQYPNDVPSDYFCPLDQSGRRRDAAERPELHRGSIEFVAPAEYMVRPPMPPVYLFVLEVTPAAVSCGALAAMVSGIKLSIAALPQEGRTRVGIITFDAAVHFYHLPAGEDADPSISTVADITEMFLPSPDGILVHLTDSRPAFVKALDMIASTGKSGQANISQPPRQTSVLSAPSCLGAALQGAQKVMEHYGGKMVVMAASRPTVGPGALRDRDDSSSFFTDRERALLRSDTTFYRLMGVEFSKFQISCDLFCCAPPPGSYMDIATVGQLAKITGGELFRASCFEAYRDHARLQRAVYRTLSRETGFEAVMRIRATKSIRCSNFHGRFFVRSTDLLAMPSVDCDKTYAVQFSFDESLITSDGPFCVQVALLYTTTGGERRIRVHTVAAPITNSMTDLFIRVDAPATANLFTRLAAEAAKERVLDELKKNFADKVMTALAVYRTDCMQQYPTGTGIGPGGGSQQLFIPDAMNLLPLFMHGLLKTAFLSRDTAASFLHRIDDKAALLHAVDVMSIAQTTAMLYPNMISVLPATALGPQNLSDSKGPTIPEAVAASMSSLKTDVAVLVDDGDALLLWLGASVLQSFAAELLDCPPQAVSAGVDPRQLAYKLMESVQLKGSAAYVRSVIKAVAALRPAGTPLFVIPAGSAMQARVEALCVEDRTASSMGYKEFLTEVQRQVTSKSSTRK